MTVEMTVTPQRRKQTGVVSSPGRQQKSKRSQKNQSAGSIIVPGLKASLAGGFGFLFLMLIGLIPPVENLPISLAFLVVPGFLVVCLSTGLLASILAGDRVENSHQGGKVGWMAGFWAGIFGGIVAMIMAAFGIYMANFGQGIVNQFTPDQLQTFTRYGLTPETIALTGRVFGALLVYGFAGSLVSALLSAFGGMIYPKLSG